MPEGTSSPAREMSWSCSPTTFRCRPGSSRRRRRADARPPSRPEVEIDGVKTRVIIEQLTVIDPEVRLGEFAGRLESAEMRAVDEAMLTVLGLD